MSLTRATLLSLKLAQLKQLAVQCGVNSSGSKTVIAAQIDETVTTDDHPANLTKHGVGRPTRPADRGTERILSIDMGIRNLAYCVLETSATSSAEAAVRTGPLVLAWKRIAVAPRAPSAPSSSSSDKVPKESFEPFVFAAHAHDLLAHILLPHGPSRILIERQRYRSMGSSAVQEWTVRVNMFEGMLYAVLRTLRAEKKWLGEEEGVSPARVTAYWVGDELVGAAKDEGEDESGGVKGKKRRPRTTAKAKSKGAKVDLVGRWLRDGEAVRFDGEGPAGQTRDAFVQRWQGKARRQRVKVDRLGLDKDEAPVGSAEEEIGKLDDLADCLLQGMAHIRWEENRRRLAEGEEPQTLLAAIAEPKETH